MDTDIRCYVSFGFLGCDDGSVSMKETLLTLRRQFKCLEYDVCKLPYKL